MVVQGFPKPLAGVRFPHPVLHYIEAPTPPFANGGAIPLFLLHT